MAMSNPLRKCWSDMIRRCHGNPKNKDARNYKQRGIIVCERWRKSFHNFAEDVGQRPTPQHSIHRIDNDGNYEPGNVRWATRIEQGRNTRTSRFLTINGETKTLTEWAEEKKLDRRTLRFRITVLQWPLDLAVNTPARPRRQAR